MAAAKNGQAGRCACNPPTSTAHYRSPYAGSRWTRGSHMVKEHQPDVDVIMLTGHGDVKDAVEAMKQGAWDFLVKDTPFEGTTVKAALAKLRTVRALRQENLAARRGGFSRDVIVEGPSEAWQRLKSQIDRVARSHASVLIRGETGSGKEIAARLLHAMSSRSDGPFLAVNCGAVSRELLESELFGHEKGAFTGAASSTVGLAAAAEMGTLFLDEIGEMPAPMQVSMLRFLDRGEYRPVGSTRTLRADVWIIGAPIKTPRSRHPGRSSDCSTLDGHLGCAANSRAEGRYSMLAEHLLPDKSVRSSGRSLSPDAITALASYPWPGNVRELRNVIERLAMIGIGSGPISREEVAQVLPKHPAAFGGGDPSCCSLDEMERLHIQRVLESTGGNKTQAAKMLRIDYKTLLAN